jgi:hypothetical protein
MANALGDTDTLASSPLPGCNRAMNAAESSARVRRTLDFCNGRSVDNSSLFTKQHPAQLAEILKGSTAGAQLLAQLVQLVIHDLKRFEAARCTFRDRVNDGLPNFALRFFNDLAE